ncbi:hypothetical protein BBEV_2635 [Salisediminibacterium beveridgei]|uniref:Peptidase propeptide and YPEB domain-containing protein n=2 Tax=Salisediminibacterium beveridgei TaxID=632773 RepID=A0A1D7QY88_9BACI|nr:hypothetical protein BBEV_2635 [Salisediminibacterium beveridgei]
MTVDQTNGMMLSLISLDTPTRFESEDEDEEAAIYSFEEIQQVILNEFGEEAEILEFFFLDKDPPFLDVIIRSGNQTGELQINALTGEILPIERDSSAERFWYIPEMTRGQDG